MTGSRSRTALIAVAIATIVAVEIPSELTPIQRDFEELSNSDVTWAGTYAGLMPEPSERVKRIGALGAEVTPALKEALKDHDKYVAAHVLLTWAARKGTDDSSFWYGLEVQLYADGRTVIPNQQQKILALWTDVRAR